MTDPKDKKKKQKPPPEDKNKGGGGEPLTKEDFLRVLDRAISPPKPPDQEKGETSE